MGCDIHFFAEVNHHGKWLSQDKWSYDFGHSPPRMEVDYDDCRYGSRDYPLFAVLAGVRNYGEFVTISEPRGIPDDCDALVRAAVDHYGVDGHSHSWLTVSEILAYPHWDDLRADLFQASTLRERSVGFFEALDAMQKWIDVERLRIVFFFDN